MIKNVAIIGASGRLGPAVLQALLSSRAFNITVLARASSKSAFPSEVNLIKIPDDGGDEDTITGILHGQDALVVTMPASRPDDIIKLANACEKAGVQRFIPPDFGSVDSTDEKCLELVPLYRQKGLVRDHCQRIAERTPSLSWTSLVSGHFFDWGLKSGLFRFDLNQRTASILDDGNVRWSASTLSRIGEAVVKVLQKEEESKNKMLHIQSFCVSQNQVLQALERASGRGFSVSYKSSQDVLAVASQKMAKGDPEATEELVSTLGLTRANWESMLANELLGLSRDNLDEVVGAVYASASEGN